MDRYENKPDSQNIGPREITSATNVKWVVFNTATTNQSISTNHPDSMELLRKLDLRPIDVRDAIRTMHNDMELFDRMNSRHKGKKTDFERIALREAAEFMNSLKGKGWWSPNKGLKTEDGLYTIDEDTKLRPGADKEINKTIRVIGGPYEVSIYVYDDKIAQMHGARILLDASMPPGAAAAMVVGIPISGFLGKLIGA